MSSIKECFCNAVWLRNPITFQVLGICSALAVTAEVKTALVMSFIVIITLCLNNAIISFLRSHIPYKVRMIVQLIIISSLVIIADQILKAYFYSLSRELSIFVGLIITNCLIMGRGEGFALINSVTNSLLDGLFHGLGYSIVLIFIASIREILGQGTWLGINIISTSFYAMGYENCGLMLMAPGAFFLLALIIAINGSIKQFVETSRETTICKKV